MARKQGNLFKAHFFITSIRFFSRKLIREMCRDRNDFFLQHENSVHASCQRGHRCKMLAIAEIH